MTAEIRNIAAVDMGNTRIKVGIFREGQLVAHQAFPDHVSADAWLRTFAPARLAFCISGAGPPPWFAANLPAPMVLRHDTPIPIRSAYRTPETLGMDRLAAVIGAGMLFPEEACLVIDAGTCITYDFLTRDGVYLGGGISPGLLMRLKAMHTFTASLPLIDQLSDYELVGDTTRTCMTVGALHGTLNEVAGFIKDYSEKFGQFKVILSGGDAEFFENKLKASIFVSHHLTLFGLYSIIEFDERF